MNAVKNLVGFCVLIVVALSVLFTVSHCEANNAEYFKITAADGTVYTVEMYDGNSISGIITITVDDKTLMLNGYTIETLYHEKGE